MGATNHLSEDVAGLVCDETTQAQIPPAERGEHGNNLPKPDPSIQPASELDSLGPDRDAPSAKSCNYR